MKDEAEEEEGEEGEGEEKVSRRQPRTAGENGRDEERGGDPWGASSPTSIMEEVCVWKCLCVGRRARKYCYSWRTAQRMVISSYRHKHIINLSSASNSFFGKYFKLQQITDTIDNIIII